MGTATCDQLHLVLNPFVKVNFKEDYTQNASCYFLLYDFMSLPHRKHTHVEVKTVLLQCNEVIRRRQTVLTSQQLGSVAQH